MDYRRALSGAGLALCITTNACTTFYTAAPEQPLFTKAEMDALDINKDRSNTALRFTDPAQLCNEIRGNALKRRNEDTWTGAILATAGAGAAAVGIAEASQSGHTPVWAGLWSAAAGAGAAVVALGVYYLLRGGEDRAAFWTTNGAVASIQADYRSLPMELPPPGKSAFEAAIEAKKAAMNAQVVADEAANKAKDADTRLAALVQFDLKEGVAPNPGDDARAAIAAALAAFKKDPRNPEIKLQQDVANFYQGYDTKGNPAPHPSPAVVSALPADTTAHDTATDKARLAEEAANKATLALNYLAAEQAAWGHCAAALSALGPNDAATNQGYANSLNAIPGTVK